MEYRRVTPPLITAAYLPDSTQSDNTSNETYYSQNSSPDSILTHITTPSRSPICQQGPLLLPKPRCQDQVIEPTAGPIRHRKSSSNANSSFQNTLFPYTLQRPGVQRRSTSPAVYRDASPASAVSAPSPYDCAFNSALNSPITFGASQSHSRANSASGLRHGHSRSGSGSSLDDSTIGRYGYPTYRRMPSYVTNAAIAPTTVTHAPCAVAYAQAQQLTHAPQASHSPEFSFATNLTHEPSHEPTATTSLADYLTAPNPAPTLVRRTFSAGNGQPYAWFDVRNLRNWSDFNITTITAIPGIFPLLRVPIACTELPAPPRANVSPETESALHDMYRDHYATRINAALKVAQGNSYIAMRAYKRGPAARPQPDFISNYQSDYEKTIHGDLRGRVVGLVKSYDQWNTGMRSESPNTHVQYLAGLSHLHHLMREQGCRYGFLITEIELLCVRCGGPPPADSADSLAAKDSSVPLYGYLETSAPISLATRGSDAETGAPQMTASLALWYLHMLAKEDPLPGIAGTWRMEVGGPAALTRQNCLARDPWIPKVMQTDQRAARRARGWVWPEEPLCRKERGKGKRGRRM